MNDQKPFPADAKCGVCGEPLYLYDTSEIITEYFVRVSDRGFFAKSTDCAGEGDTTCEWSSCKDGCVEYAWPEGIVYQ
jgi:hypothetical protein